MSTLLKTAHRLTVFSGLVLVMLAGGSAFTANTTQSSVPTNQNDQNVLAQSDNFGLDAQAQPVSDKAEVESKKPEPKAPAVSKPITATASVPQPAKPAASPPAASTSISEGVSASLAFVNNVRAEIGKSALKLDSVLNAYALNHAKNLAAQCQLSHQNLSLMIGKPDATGKKITAIAENVAYSSSSLAQALNGLKNSDGHYKNMTGNYTRAGFGVVKSGAAACKNHIYTVQVFAKS